MSDKVYAVKGKIQVPTLGGSFSGIGLPFIRFELASNPEEAVERLSKALVEKNQDWLRKVESSETDDVRYLGQEPPIPFDVCRWEAVEVSVPGHMIIIEKV